MFVLKHCVTMFFFIFRMYSVTVTLLQEEEEEEVDVRVNRFSLFKLCAVQLRTKHTIKRISFVFALTSSIARCSFIVSHNHICDPLRRDEEVENGIKLSCTVFITMMAKPLLLPIFEHNFLV